MSRGETRREKALEKIKGEIDRKWRERGKEM